MKLIVIARAQRGVCRGGVFRKAYARLRATATRIVPILPTASITEVVYACHVVSRAATVVRRLNASARIITVQTGKVLCALVSDDGALYRPSDRGFNRDGS